MAGLKIELRFVDDLFCVDFNVEEVSSPVVGCLKV